MSITATVLADALYNAVVRDLTSRYCPADRAAFLGRSAILLAAFAGIALLCFSFAKFMVKNEQAKKLAYICACAIAVFAIGSAALVIFGLSGCTGEAQAGLTWDWP